MLVDFLSNPKLKDYDLSSLRVLGGGGAAMPEALAKKLEEVIGLPFVEGRSEERRVGKECGEGWAGQTLKEEAAVSSQTRTQSFGDFFFYKQKTAYEIDM